MLESVLEGASAREKYSYRQDEGLHYLNDERRFTSAGDSLYYPGIFRESSSSRLNDSVSSDCLSNLSI